MTSFLPTAGGGLINANQITRMFDRDVNKGVRDKPHWRAIAVVAGKEVEMMYSTSEILASTQPVVAAQPGYSVVAYYTDYAENGQPGVSRYLVVAWRIDGECVTPVTLDDKFVAANCVGWGVLTPDGQVILPLAETYASEAEWLAAMEQRAAKPKAAE